MFLKTEPMDLMTVIVQDEIDGLARSRSWVDGKEERGVEERIASSGEVPSERCREAWRPHGRRGE
ncbi:hypothetical protein [Planctomycetes bacterium Pan216]|uniref:hypothetical protein n=1 Tax=Kolteria novifilia TaxID=2527975 RepID=UPI0011A4FBA4